MSNNTELHPSISAMVALAANVVAHQSTQATEQQNQLRALNVPEEQINAAIAIARQVRDQAVAGVDGALDANQTVAHPVNCCTPGSTTTCCG